MAVTPGGWSGRRMSMGAAAEKDDEANDRATRTPRSAALTTTRAATMVNRVPRAALRASALCDMPPVKAARRCQAVCRFRYAGDICEVVAWDTGHACVDRGGRALHGGSH